MNMTQFINFTSMLIASYLWVGCIAINILVSNLCIVNSKCERRDPLTCGLDVDAPRRSLHQTSGHLVILVLLRETRVLVRHQTILQQRIKD